jgi:hypothetical protein
VIGDAVATPLSFFVTFHVSILAKKGNFFAFLGKNYCDPEKRSDFQPSVLYVLWQLSCLRFSHFQAEPGNEEAENRRGVVLSRSCSARSKI